MVGGYSPKEKNTGKGGLSNFGRERKRAVFTEGSLVKKKSRCTNHEKLLHKSERGEFLFQLSKKLMKRARLNGKPRKIYGLVLRNKKKERKRECGTKSTIPVEHMGKIEVPFMRQKNQHNNLQIESRKSK